MILLLAAMLLANMVVGSFFGCDIIGKALLPASLIKGHAVAATYRVLFTPIFVSFLIVLISSTFDILT